MTTGNKLLKDPKKLSHAYGFAGVNNAGPGPASIALADAVVGQKVSLIFEATGGTYDAAPLFEDKISVAGHIQQLSVSDLSAKKYIVFLE